MSNLNLSQMQLCLAQTNIAQLIEDRLQIISHQLKRGASADLKLIRQASEDFHDNIPKATEAAGVSKPARHKFYMRWFDLNDIENELIQLAETAKVKP